MSSTCSSIGKYNPLYLALLYNFIMICKTLVAYSLEVFKETIYRYVILTISCGKECNVYCS